MKQASVFITSLFIIKYFIISYVVIYNVLMPIHVIHVIYYQ